jgi:hypothetical protein
MDVLYFENLRGFVCKHLELKIETSGEDSRSGLLNSNGPISKHIDKIYFRIHWNNFRNYMEELRNEILCVI